jgi:hypothetical protein
MPGSSLTQVVVFAAGAVLAHVMNIEAQPVAGAVHVPGLVGFTLDGPVDAAGEQP